MRKIPLRQWEKVSKIFLNTSCYILNLRLLTNKATPHKSACVRVRVCLCMWCARACASRPMFVIYWVALMANQFSELYPIKIIGFSGILLWIQWKVAKLFVIIYWFTWWQTLHKNITYPFLLSQTYQFHSMFKCTVLNDDSLFVNKSSSLKTANYKKLQQKLNMTLTGVTWWEYIDFCKVTSRLFTRRIFYIR